MTVRMRHTKGHTGNRRSHHALKEASLTKCVSCGAMRVRHQACTACGMYRGRLVTDAKARQERVLKRKQEKLKALGQPASQTAKEKEAE